jgi:hypothetical protein
MRTEVDDLVTVLTEALDETLFEVESGVVGSGGDSCHATMLARLGFEGAIGAAGTRERSRRR